MRPKGKALHTDNGAGGHDRIAPERVFQAERLGETGHIGTSDAAARAGLAPAKLAQKVVDVLNRHVRCVGEPMYGPGQSQ